MHIDRVCFLTPGWPGVFEVANQLFLLGIDTDNRRACGLKNVLLALYQLKLRLAIRMCGAGLLLFHIYPQRVA
jgi:hypothetical protein